MTRFSLYTFFLLLYLGLAQSANIDRGLPYIAGSGDLARQFEPSSEEVVSILLVDSYSKGHLIKTFYHRYLILTASEKKEKLARVSYKFFEESRPFLGMSLYRRYSKSETSYLALPPMALFIGPYEFGQWSSLLGEEKWEFHRSKTHLNFLLEFEGPVVSHRLQNYIVECERKGRLQCFGPGHEFGLEGSVTKQLFPDAFKNKERQYPSLRSVIEKSFDLFHGVHHE